MKPSELTAEELRIRCAEKCGWSIKLTGVDAPLYTVYKPDGRKWDCNFYKNIHLFLPNYEHDRNELYELILEVTADKRIAFLDEILRNNKERGIIMGRHDSTWSILTAPPLAIMRAFLEVME